MVRQSAEVDVYWGKSVSIGDYATALEGNGTAVWRGEPGAIWMQYETAAMVRVPAFSVKPVPQHEARQVLWNNRTGVINFLLEPDDKHHSNAYLYLCKDRSYTLEKLQKEARRDARRAQRSLHVGPIDWQTLLRNGYIAYSETRSRIGLSDGSLACFQKRFGAFARCAAHHAIGAWKGETLVAFMTLIVVDEWVTIEGCFSTNTGREDCPNNGLAHYVLNHFLAERRAQTVCYGTSSIQDVNQEGLHSYKTRIGFEAIPVHRAFIAHPFLRPLANPVVLWSINAALRFRPSDRRLRKIGGIVNYLASKNSAFNLRRRTLHEFPCDSSS